MLDRNRKITLVASMISFGGQWRASDTHCGCTSEICCPVSSYETKTELIILRWSFQTGNLESVQ